ncbi:MAG TPA: CHASE3 domain-containing protein [Pyrinomonadaceae bacterium]|jgi:PAS domain S-box-containing protein
MKLTLERQIPLVFAIAILLLIIVVFFAFRSVDSLSGAVTWEKHTREVITQLDETLNLIVDAETGGRGFIITAEDSFLEPYTNAQQKIDGNLSHLRELVSDNPEQAERVSRLETLVNERLGVLKQAIEMRRTKSIAEVQQQVGRGRGRDLMNEVRALIDNLKNEEKSILENREAALNRSLTSTYRMLYLAGIAGALSLGLANLAIFREIGKRRKAEDELRDSNKDLEARVEKRTGELSQKNDELKEQIRQREQTENLHRIALEAGNLGTWIFDAKTGSAELDERGLALFGFSAADFDGDAFGRIHREDETKVREALRKSLTEKTNFDAEFRVLAADGKTRWSHCTGQTQLDEDGRAVKIVGNCRDITNLKENEAFIRQSEIFTRSILDSLSAHIAVLDREGNIVAVNSAWENFAFSNCVEGDVTKTGIGQNYLKICEQSGEFLEESSPVLKNLRRVLNGESTGFSHEYPCHSPDEERWFLLQVGAMKDEGEGAVISHINITDRKKAELELKNSEEFNRSVFENSPDCVKVLEIDGTLHEMNVNGLCLMEIDDFASFRGKQWIDFWEDDENEMAYQALEAARGGKPAHFEGFCRTAKGAPKWWDVSVAPIFGSDGKPVRIIATSHDISFRRDAETEREELLKKEQAARKDAEIANRLRDEFLATVSHELRAPLNSILGWGRLLEKGNLDEKTTGKALETIIRNAEAQNRLIDDLLDVSRIISGKFRLEIINTRPIDFVEAALETVRPAAEAKGIALEIKQETVISHISGDPNRLQQVIWNLLSNAIKFTPNAGRVSVEIVRTNGSVEIRVTDTGVGIREEFLPHVFDRFRQADASSIRKFGGLGLGLAIVRHITEMHGGTVAARSEGENRGSTFVVSLPLISNFQRDESEDARKSILPETAQKLSLDGLLILVVDDEEDTRQLLVQSLTFYGATVVTAKSAGEGLIEVVDKTPDVLVSDIGMPEEDGYSLIRKVRALTDEQQKSVKAIALTAFTRAQDRMRALAAGYQNHVAKPVEPDELATVIASLTGRLRIEED